MGLRVETDSVFDVARVIYVVKVFLVNIARVGLLEGTCAIGAITRVLLRSDCLRVCLPCRVCVSDSVVHLLKAVEHRFAGLVWSFLLGKCFNLICGILTVKVH